MTTDPIRRAMRTARQVDDVAVSRAMPTVLLVRHGQASYGADDYDVLSERGHRQSAAVAQALAARGIRPALVVAGSLRRQRDTAAPVLEAAGVELGVDPAWNEYDSDDVLTHHSDSGVRMDRTDAPADAPQVSSRRFQEILDAALLDWIAAGTDSSADETWPAFVSRATAGLERVVAQLESGQTAVVSTSGGVIGVLA